MNLLPTYAAEGRIVRNKWSAVRVSDGSELLCIYTAIAGDPKARPESCPANLIPTWLAHVLPACDDNGSEAAWPGMVARWAAVSDRLHLLVGERGDRLRSRWLARVLRGLPETPDRDGVLVLLDRHGAGGEVTRAAWRAAAGAEWAWWAEAAESEWDRMTSDLLNEIEAEVSR